MYKRAVIPLDGSPVAEAILPFILEIAGPLDMEVVLLRVVRPLAPVVIEGTRHIMVDDAGGRARRRRGIPGAAGRRVAQQGRPGGDAGAARHPADEIVAGGPGDRQRT